MSWFFRRKKEPHKVLKKVIVGLIIGGAIGSVIGKRLLSRQRPRDDDEE